MSKILEHLHILAHNCSLTRYCDRKHASVLDPTCYTEMHIPCEFLHSYAHEYICPNIFGTNLLKKVVHRWIKFLHERFMYTIKFVFKIFEISMTGTLQIHFGA